MERVIVCNKGAFSVVWKYFVFKRLDVNRTMVFCRHWVKVVATCSFLYHQNVKFTSNNKKKITNCFVNVTNTEKNSGAI